MLPMTDTLARPQATADSRRRTADVIFRGALAFNAALTVFWLATFLRGGSFFFQDYRVDWDDGGPDLLRRPVLLRDLGRHLVGDQGGAASLLRRVHQRGAARRVLVAHGPPVRRRRPRQPLLGAAHPHHGHDRPPRPVHHAGGRRLLLPLSPGRAGPEPRLRQPRSSRTTCSTASSPAGSSSAFYRVSGLLGAFFYGPQSRVMDGVLARANCLLITTLWTVFKFVMVPIGVQLAAVFPKEEFAPVFALIWGSYLVTDASAEIFGSLFGKQRIRVWGIGDVNRKSVTGIVAGFLAALIFCVWVVTAHGLGTPWLVLSLVLAISNSLLELYSPRGTDDFTMATANALICWAFGAWLR